MSTISTGRTARLTQVARAVLASVGLVALTALATPAHAVLVTPGTNGSEPGLYQVMNSLYGAGNWTQLDDSLVQSATNTGISIGVDYEIRYARDNASFGVFKDGTTFSPFLTVTQSGASPTSLVIGSSSLSSAVGGVYELGFRNDTTSQLFSSNLSKNVDGRSHLIEFQILSMPNTFVMAWEDMVGGDYDYQDLILQYVLNFNPTPRPVPEPMTLSLLGAALIAGGGARRYFKSKRTLPA